MPTKGSLLACLLLVVLWASSFSDDNLGIVYYTYHTDAGCSSPIYSTRYAQYPDNTGVARNVRTSTCLPYQDGSNVVYSCRLNPGGKMYALSFRSYLASDTACANPLAAHGTVYEHAPICFPDALRGGFAKVRCGATASDVALLSAYSSLSSPASQESINLPALYTSPGCLSGPITSKVSFLHTCTPSQAGSFKGPHGGALHFFYILDVLNFQPIKLRLRKFGAKDANCSHTVVGQRYITYPPTGAVGNTTCTADPLFHGCYYINNPASAPYFYTTPTFRPTSVPTTAPSPVPSPVPSARPTAMPSVLPTVPTPSPTPVPTSTLSTYKVITASGTYVPPYTGLYDVFLIAGGGGGGGGHAGGGGAGGVVVKLGQSLTAGTSYAVTIGAGGAGGVSTGVGSNGGNTVFGTLATAYGGGGGGTYCNANPSDCGNGLSGGSGGGGGADKISGSLTGGSATSVSPAQGYSGGNACFDDSDAGNGGGGGGAGALGSTAICGGTVGSGRGGAGGAGISNLQWPSFPSFTSLGVGVSGMLAGGGGGGAWATCCGNTAGRASGGGGGAGYGECCGGPGYGSMKGQAATANTGSGGGGGPDYSTGGGAGGSGLIIVRPAITTTAFALSGFLPAAATSIGSCSDATKVRITAGSVRGVYVNGGSATSPYASYAAITATTASSATSATWFVYTVEDSASPNYVKVVTVTITVSSGTAYATASNAWYNTATTFSASSMDTYYGSRLAGTVATAYTAAGYGVVGLQGYC